MHICGFGLRSSASLVVVALSSSNKQHWRWSWTLWLSLRDRFAPTSCQEAKPGCVQVGVDENLISTLLGSQSGCHVRGCR